MLCTTSYVVYGHPPRGLVDIAPACVQVSPLVPGAQRLADLPSGNLASAVVYAPPGTIERRAVCAAMLQSLAIGAPLTVLGPTDRGGRRIADELRHFGCVVSDVARAHHRICTTTRPDVLRGVDEALAAGSLQQHPTHGLWTQPGVFSWDRVDAGSASLVASLPMLAGRGADLGCGIGVLARGILQSPAVQDLVLVDIDRRALDAADRNINDARARTVWADVRSPTLPCQDLDFIVSNPPFHDSGVEDKTIGQMFLTRSAAMLKRGGALWLVANRHLPYELTLRALFKQVDVVSDENGFKIFKAVKS